MTEEQRDLLCRGLTRLGVPYTPEAVERLGLYCRRLLEKNQVMNLTAITDPADVMTLHFLDSAALLPTRALGGRKLIDVGTGAGFPGLVLRILDPTIRLTLLDSLGKRVEWLTELCRELDLPDVVLLKGRAEELSREEGMVNIHPYADPYVAAGQGTIGLEIVADLPDAAAVAVPIGGGGLISGVATAVKGLSPSIRTIGVEPAGAPRYGKSRAAGEPVALEKVETIADGTRTDHANPDNFEMIQARVDDLCAVDDTYIRQAIRLLMDKAKLTVEPSGTLPVKPEDKVVFVLSGGNLDPALAAQLLQE